MNRYTLWTAVLAMPAAVWAAGAEPGVTPSTASNQPAALDHRQRADQDPGPAAPNVGRAVLPTVPLSDIPEEASPKPTTDPGEEVSPSDTAATARTIRPPVPGANQPAAGLLRTQTLPWYRTGLVSLGVVLAAIVGISWLIRRLFPSVRAMSGGAIEVLGRNHLAHKQSLTLVRVGRRIVLVGVTPERMSTLCEIDDPHEVAELLGKAPGTRALGEVSRFQETLGEAASAFEDSSAEVTELTRGPSEGLARAKGQVQGLLTKLKSLQAQA